MKALAPFAESNGTSICGIGVHSRAFLDVKRCWTSSESSKSKNALKRTPIPHIEVPLDSEKGAHAFIDESGQAETPIPKAEIGTRLHSFGKASQLEKKKMITVQAQAGVFGKDFKGEKGIRKKRERK